MAVSKANPLPSHMALTTPNRSTLSPPTSAPTPMGGLSDRNEQRGDRLEAPRSQTKHPRLNGNREHPKSQVPQAHAGHGRCRLRQGGGPVLLESAVSFATGRIRVNV